MEVTSQAAEGGVDVHLKGRLDGYWADHLSHALEEIVRGGHHHIRLNMNEVAYMSSLGIRVLVTFYKKLGAIEGTFFVRDASPAVKKVLDMVGLSASLMPAAVSAPATGSAATPVSRALDREKASFEIYDLGSGSLSCESLGNPSLLDGCRFGENDCRTVSLPDRSFGFGLGAFGRSFPECRDRFGEFLAVAGAAAYQPTDGSNVPDFQLAEGAFVPEIGVLYGALCSGSFSALARFESKREHGTIGLTELAEAALEICAADQAGIVCVAESAGLVGASLRRPPVNGGGNSALFAHPEIRSWLSFTTERAYADALAIVVGVAARRATGPLAAMLRPLNRHSGVDGHFHAAAFSYCPLPRGSIDLHKTVRHLFEEETLQGILHLIGDDRDAVGVSESEFVRGACWIGPILENDSAGRQA